MLLTVWTGPVVLSVIFSSFALLASAISIGWQVYTWRHNGPRVVVKPSTGITWGPMGNHKILTITATNEGRASTMALSFGWELPDKQVLIDPNGSYLNPVALPAELAPGGEVTYFYNPESVRERLKEAGLDLTSIRPFIRTGHGTIYGKPLKSA
ncbi:hypothetical protein ACFFOM_18565 [Microlunatus capsulatus]|uniref:Uncharacterized protein n=1 Tax=Microlunatus capsulatus TaxID=99117 RepID=A0ABS4ZDA5_9ACTN|nr:hypothetical protein [Microlunatus capsulatus]MBP2419011.1 hypothetical protein [Microlunatus capsulatus]